MPQTFGSRPMKAASTRRLAASAVVLAAVIGFGGLLLAVGWSQAGLTVSRSVDQMLWTQALRRSPTVTELGSLKPVWREREGASGDRIIERIDARGQLAGGSAASVAVLDQVVGETLPAAVLAEQAAKRADAMTAIVPASLEGLSAGDRLTITTADGHVYAFDVLSPNALSDSAAPNELRIVVQPITQSAGQELVTLHVRPVDPSHSASSLLQQEL